MLIVMVVLVVVLALLIYWWHTSVPSFHTSLLFPALLKASIGQAAKNHALLD